MSKLPVPLDDVLPQIARHLREGVSSVTVHSDGGPFDYHAMFRLLNRVIVARLRMEFARLDEDRVLVVVPLTRFGLSNPLLSLVVCSRPQSAMDLRALLRQDVPFYVVTARLQPSNDVDLTRLN